MNSKRLVSIWVLGHLLLLLQSSVVIAEDAAGFEGIIEPSEVVNVGTPVAGVVATLNVERSVSVKKGESLVVLESSVEDAMVEKAKVFAEASGEVQLQEESLAYAKRVFSRIKELYDGDAISTEKFDQAKTEVALALMRLQKAKENKEIARLDLARAKAIQKRKTIKSPINGIVTERYVSPGEFVETQPLVKIAQMDPLRVEVVLPADMFYMIKPGMEAEIHPDIMEGRQYLATVTIVDRLIDPASGTFGVRLELPNPDYQLPSGLKCMVRFKDVEGGFIGGTGASLSATK